MVRFAYLVVLFLAAESFLGGAPFGGSAAFGQGSAPTPITPKITTVDGVKLNATFYPSAKKNSPVVIMVHPIGDGKSSKSPEWKGLAELLQSKDFAVITFDLRGHGDSTTIDDPQLFWAQKANVFNVKTKDKEAIDVKDFIKSKMYIPVLANDIAAVKSYLERQNDLGECNTASTIVIGADNGATLAALWINSEWMRFKYTPNPMNPRLPGITDKQSEGRDIIGAVFLTIQPNLTAERSVSVVGLLRNACGKNAMAAMFLYGSDDAKAKEVAKSLEGKLKSPKSKKHEFIGAVDRDTNLSGIKLLQKGLKTDQDIVKYLGAVVEDRGAEWGQRSVESNHYVWRLPNMAPAAVGIPARNQKGSKNLNFNDYNQFITP